MKRTSFREELVGVEEAILRLDNEGRKYTSDANLKERLTATGNLSETTRILSEIICRCIIVDSYPMGDNPNIYLCNAN